VNLRTAGSSTGRSADILDGGRRSLAPLVIVTVAALVFAILLILVRLQWAPLESADHGAAAGINSLVAGNATLVAVVKAITWLGSSGVLWTVIGAATVILALRRRWRLAAYLLVTGVGALILDPVLKCCLYIAIAILVIGHARGWWRWLFLIPAIAMPVLVALSRLYRGEHHPTDLLASLLFAGLWLTATSLLIKPNAGRKERDGTRDLVRGADVRPGVGSGGAVFGDRGARAGVSPVRERHRRSH
jgi:hypothetical protein